MNSKLTASRDTLEGSPNVEWSALQPKFMQDTEADVLIFLDCCAAAGSARSAGQQGMVEVIAAPAFESTTPVRGQHAFTASLKKELQECLLRDVAPNEIVAVYLHTRLINRLKRYIPPDGTERRITPIHYYLAHGKTVRSVRLYRWEETSNLSTEAVSSGERQGDVAETSDISVMNAFREVWPDPNFKHDKVLIAINLSRSIDQTLDRSSFRQWLREVPALVDLINIEAVHKSSSTLILASVSIAVWDLMPNLATRFVGFISSENLKFDLDQDDDIAEVPWPRKTADASYEAWQDMLLRLPAPISESPSDTTTTQVSDTKTTIPIAPSTFGSLSARSRLQAMAKSFSRTLTNAYVYQDIKDHEMRLLKILHGETAARLECMLFATEIPGYSGQNARSIVAPYACISYWMGENHEIASNRIVIYYDTGGRENLKAALLRLRSSDTDVDVWVDMLCINQESLLERSGHVSKMPAILRGSEVIYAWLGDGTSETKPTFDFLRSILDLNHLSSIIETRAMPERWNLEVILSPVVIIRWGDESMLWSDFEDAISLVLKNISAIKKIFSLGGSNRYFPEHDYNHAAACINAKRHITRGSASGAILQKIVTLEELATSMFVNFEVLDPRDALFSLLSLSKEPLNSHESKPQEYGDSRIAPNYGKCYTDVIGHFMDYCIEKSQSLDIISRPWAPSPLDVFDQILSWKEGSDYSEASRGSYGLSVESHPTWIALVDRGPFDGFEEIAEGRVNADSFVQGSGHASKSTYNASFGIRPVAQFGRRSILQSPGEPKGQSTLRLDGALFVKGLVLGSVDLVSNRVPRGKIIPDNGLEICRLARHPKHRHQDSGYDPTESWRILVADRDPDGYPAPRWYHRVILECLEHTDRAGDLDLNNILRLPQINPAMVIVIERIRCMVWGRRFF
ncbi:hypothetical protein DL98DRAFT_582972 [Cadophora sp. DSE1049]|nr:hypothetical protein DL98DRAFT_582972 [Cadophora sp. DSE1049]